MKLKWDVYLYNLSGAILKSIGVQGVSWSGINGLSAAGMDVPALNLQTLGWMFVVGAIAPAVFKYWERTPLPEIVEETITTTTTKMKVVATEPPADPTAQPDTNPEIKP